MLPSLVITEDKRGRLYLKVDEFRCCSYSKKYFKKL